MYVCTLVMMMMKTECITIYRSLTKALELMGFENATDLNKQYEDKGSGLVFCAATRDITERIYALCSRYNPC